MKQKASNVKFQVPNQNETSISEKLESEIEIYVFDYWNLSET